jgi:hypothetical protein
MAVKDLDAKRAARSEAQSTPHEVRLGGETFTLPPKIPLESIELMGEAKFREAFKILLGDDDTVRRFFAHRPDDGDLEELMGLYGPAPESLASPVSSLNGGRPQSKTGKRTTTAT